MKKKGRIKKRKHFSLDSEYGKAFEFLKESKDYIYIAILVFSIFTVIGFFFSDLIDSFFKILFGFSLDERILDYIRTLLERTNGMSQIELTGFIFINNLQSGFFAIALGIIFGIFPIFSAILNGYLLGFVAIMSVKLQGLFVLWRIFPHGIFELPAIFISFGLGLKLGTIFFKAKKESLSRLLFNCFRVFLLIIFPLLVVAAIIEGVLISLT